MEEGQATTSRCAGSSSQNVAVAGSGEISCEFSGFTGCSAIRTLMRSSHREQFFASRNKLLDSVSSPRYSGVHFPRYYAMSP